MNQPRRQNRYIRRLRAERGVLGKLAWAGIFLSLVAFAYYLSGIFILFGASAFFLLASYHLKHHIDDDSPQPNHPNRSKVFEYIDGSISHDPLLPSRFDERKTIHPSEPQPPIQPPSLVKTLYRHLEQEPDHSQQPIRTLAKVALKSFDEAYHSQDRHRRNELHVCTHRARKWEDLEELRECPNCRRRYDEVLKCLECHFLSCPKCLYFMPPGVGKLRLGG